MTALTLAAKVPQRRDATTLSEMTEHQSIADWHLDKRVPIAFIFAIAVQTGAGLEMLPARLHRFEIWNSEDCDENDEYVCCTIPGDNKTERDVYKGLWSTIVR